MPLRKLISGLLLLLIVGLTACDSTRDEQEVFERQALSAPEGITETNEAGEIVSADPDDWRVAPHFPPPAVRITPPHPNPAGTGLITLEISFGFALDFRGLILARYDPASRDLTNIVELPDASGIGPQVFDFTAGDLRQTGLSRLVVYTGQGIILTYGDILVE